MRERDTRERYGEKGGLFTLRSCASAARALLCTSKFVSRSVRFSSSTASFSIWMELASSSAWSREPRS